MRLKVVYHTNFVRNSHLLRMAAESHTPTHADDDIYCGNRRGNPSFSFVNYCESFFFETRRLNSTTLPSRSLLPPHRRTLLTARATISASMNARYSRPNFLNHRRERLSKNFTIEEKAVKYRWFGFG